MDTQSNHLLFAAEESAALNATAWDLWIAEVERILGHSADGDQAEDGYSLDVFYDLWQLPMRPEEAIGEVGNVAY